VRFVTYEEIKKLPVGTVYYECKDCVGELEGPYVKHYESDTDIFRYPAFPDVNMKGYYARHDQATLDEVRKGDHMSLSNTGGREGNFEEHAKYLVLDQADVQRTIDLLQGKKVEEAVCSLKGSPWED
jgi:hypothetical protein